MKLLLSLGAEKIWKFHVEWGKAPLNMKFPNLVCQASSGKKEFSDRYQENSKAVADLPTFV
jgi:hypothetical protein